MGSVLNAIDTDLALERAGGNQELARELYQMLQKELPNYLSTIKQHYEYGNYSALLAVVHKLNGSATYCGVPALKEAASNFESNLKAGADNTYAGGMVNVISEIERLQKKPDINF